MIDNDVTACFANPGTSEMQFVSALDRQPKMRPVLCLFEGVATGAADGYGRIAGKPACTLLHLGPGYGNGLANLHNARRAFTPIVNVIGDHATYHRQYDAPLASDIAAIAGANSVWVKSAQRPDEVGALAAEAIGASYGPPGRLGQPDPAGRLRLVARQRHRRRRPCAAPRRRWPEPRSTTAARKLKAAAKPVILLGTTACGEAALAAAGRIAATGVRVLTDTFIGRQPRGAGRFAPDRMMYFGEMALARPRRRRPDGAGRDDGRRSLSSPIRTSPACWSPRAARPSRWRARQEDGAAALEALADALGAPKARPTSSR